MKEILPLMEENIQNNKEIIEENKGCVQIKELDWGGDQEKMKETLEAFEFDYVVATDVIFNKGHLTTFSNVFLIL